MDVHNDEVKEFQLKLEGILKEFLEQGSIEVYGDLRIVVTSFDKAGRIAFQKGNTIYVSIKARGYPDFVLRYIIAHELAHGGGGGARQGADLLESRAGSRRRRAGLQTTIHPALP